MKVRSYSSNVLLGALLTLLAASLGAVGCESSGGGGEGTAMQCKDGVDNDGDGYTDCRDQDCFEFVFCIEGESPDAVGGGGDVYIRPGDDVQGGDPPDTYVHPDEDTQGGDPVDIVEPPEDTWVGPDIIDGRPVIQVTPPALDFGAVAVGTTATRTTLVRNVGSDRLGIDRFVFDADATFALEIDGTEYEVGEGTRSGVDLDPLLLLDPGDEVELTVTFAPVVGGVSEGSIELRSNDPAHSWTEIALRGSGAVAGQAAIDVAPAQLDFGPVEVGDAARLQLEIFSLGGTDLVIDQLVLDSARTSDGFSLELDAPVSAGFPLVVAPNDSVTVHVVYAPTAETLVDERTGQPIVDTGILLIGGNTGDEPLEVPLSGYGVAVPCPVPVIICEEGDEVVPQTNLHLGGDQSFAMAGDIQRWDWSVQQPVGSQSVFVPSSASSNPTFEVNVAGTYLFQLDVWDMDDIKSCEPATYEVVVIPDEAIHIELMWTTPGDPDETDAGPFAGTDVDLHFIHPNAPADPNAPDLDGDGTPDPYFSLPHDCFWFNPHPDWGAFGDDFDDNPGLDRDDTDGAGPENVNLNVPQNGVEYEVAVHYWNDHGFGHSFATVRVYVYQSKVFEVADVQLQNYDLWSVATVDWPSGQVYQVQAPDGSFAITPDYRHPTFFNK